MPEVLTIKVDPASLSDVKQSLRENPVRLQKAVAGALNDTATHARSEISKRIREKVNIQKKDLDPSISITRATPDNLAAVVTLAKGKRLPLKYFGARQTAQGVTYQIDKSGPRKLIAHAFIVPSLGGNVFVRKQNPSTGKLFGHLPIRKPEGVSPYAVFVKGGMPELTKEDAASFLDKRLAHRLQYQGGE